MTMDNTKIPNSIAEAFALLDAKLTEEEISWL